MTALKDRIRIDNVVWLIVFVMLGYITYALYTIKNPHKQANYQYFISYMVKTQAGTYEPGNIMPAMPARIVNETQQIRNIEESIKQSIPGAQGITLLYYQNLGKVKQ